jgi:hypothetical protein
MATYYKYAEREADSQVNWAEIGRSMSDMLLNEARVREEKKAAIDQASRDYAAELANYPTGQSESARAMALKFSDDASKFMLMQDKLLKSGQLKLGDYTVTRQNILDDTETAFSLLNDFQNRYGIKMDRYKQGISQKWELEAMERIEGFGKFADSGMYIDPTTGKITMSLKEYDYNTGGMVMSKDPAKRASIPSVRGMLEGQWDKYNPNASLDAINNSIGENIRTIREIGKKGKLGEIKTVSDVLADTRKEADIQADLKAKQSQITALEGKTDKKSVAAKKKLETQVTEIQGELEASKAVFSFFDFETNAINMELENPWNRLSLMTDNMGKDPDGNPYRFVYSESEAMKNGERDESAILMEASLDGGNSYQPKFTDKQLAQTTEFMRNQLRARYDYKEQRQTVQDYSPKEWTPEYYLNRGDNKKLSADLLTQWQKLYSATTAQDKRAAANSLLGNDAAIKAGLLDIDMSDGKNVVLRYKNGVNRTIPLYTTDANGTAQLVSPSQWAAQGTELHGVRDSKEYDKYSTQTFNNVDKKEWAQVKAQRTAPTPVPTADGTGGGPQIEYKKQLNSVVASIPSNLFDEEQDDVAAKLNQIFTGYGIRATPSGTASDYVTIEIDGVGSKEFPADATFDSGAIEYRNNVINWINENLPNNDAVKNITQASAAGDAILGTN